MKKLLYLAGAIILALLVFFGSGVRLDVPAEKLKPKYANAQSKFVIIDGLSIHYRDEGQGFPLVLLHPSPSSLHTFDKADGETGKTVPRDSTRSSRLRVDRAERNG